MSRLRTGLFSLSITIGLGLNSASAVAATDEDIAEAGDWVQLLLPISGYIGTWITKDKQGAAQLTKSLAAMGLTAQAIKFTSDRARPDGTDTRSFPSDHTTAAFGGA